MDNKAYVEDDENEFVAVKKVKTPEQSSHSFEQAISLAGVGWFHYKLLLICGLCFMSVMVEIMGVSLIMPLVKCDLKPTITEQGVLASAGFMGVVLSSHAMGFLADTWGRTKTLRYGLGLAAISSIVSGFSVNIWMLIVLRFFVGFFISGGQACVFSLCGEFHGSVSRVRHVTLLSGFLCLAVMFAPSMAIGILPLRIETIVLGMRFSSWRVLLIADVSIIILSVIGLCLLPETPKYQLVQGNGEGALETMRTIFAQNTGRPKSEFPVQLLTVEDSGSSLSSINGVCDAFRLVWQQTVPIFYRSRVFHTLNLCIIQFFVYGIAQGIFMWFPTILNELNGNSEGSSHLCTVLQAVDSTSASNCEDVDLTTYYTMIIIGAAFTVVYVIFAYTIDYVGKRNLVLIWFALTTISLLALQWINQMALVVIAVTIIMAIGNCGGLIGTIAIEFYPTSINAMSMSFIMMVGRLGAVVGSNVLGRLLFSSCEVVFWTLFGISVLIIVMGWFMPDKRRPKF
ncbi:synaptic vesicle 2-related protein [Scaptodrosophila lebanonensis]|uniref:Synaptic vesicle 2-related protein n=1 Tax=Drosophila lebanonensis TaxID=7225 RepID=A0A6J2TUS0_DROLE|nr:synaptic vesicle 2-related protein [Scaptodrosophila lebanonensis]